MTPKLERNEELTLNLGRTWNGLEFLRLLEDVKMTNRDFCTSDFLCVCTYFRERGFGKFADLGGEKISYELIKTFDFLEKEFYKLKKFINYQKLSDDIFLSDCDINISIYIFAEKYQIAFLQKYIRIQNHSDLSFFSEDVYDGFFKQSYILLFADGDPNSCFFAFTRHLAYAENNNFPKKELNKLLKFIKEKLLSTAYQAYPNVYHCAIFCLSSLSDYKIAWCISKCKNVGCISECKNYFFDSESSLKRSLIRNLITSELFSRPKYSLIFMNFSFSSPSSSRRICILSFLAMSWCFFLQHLNLICPILLFCAKLCEKVKYFNCNGGNV